MIDHNIEYSDGDNISLLFNEGKHQYTVEGEYVPAVTSVLSTTIAKQKFLMPWAVKMGAEWFRDNRKDYLKGDIKLEDMIKGIKGAYRKKVSGRTQHRRRGSRLVRASNKV